MPPAHLHVMGLSLGSVSGYCILTVPRDSIFGYASPEFLDRRAGEFQGPETKQAIDIARLLRGVQGLDFRVGPAVVMGEPLMANEIDEEDLIEFRINAMLMLLKFEGKLGDSMMINLFAVLEIEEKKLRRMGLHYNKDHVNDAVLLALTALRQARGNFDLAKSLWPYRAGLDDEIGE
jgi:hypothetical protein